MLSSDPIGTNTGRREEELTVEEGSRTISDRVSIGLRGSREESTGRKQDLSFFFPVKPREWKVLVRETHCRISLISIIV